LISLFNSALTSLSSAVNVFLARSHVSSTSFVSLDITIIAGQVGVVSVNFGFLISRRCATCETPVINVESGVSRQRDRAGVLLGTGTKERTRQQKKPQDGEEFETGGN
ncbi:hypothetical protein DL98DRAFT_475345, partial [Cadophora sp. DSE1049]